MLRRVIGLTSGGAASVLLAPAAFAEDKYARIYDDDVAQPLPGTTKAPAHAENAVAQLQSKIDDKINTIEADGHTLRYNDELKEYVGVARVHVENAYAQIEQFSHKAYNTFFKNERSVSNTLASLKGEKELLPGAMCVIVATLSGSIAARRRNILLRTVAPIAFGAAAFRYFLPQTFSNTASFVYKVERDNYPALADAQDKAQKQIVGVQKEVETAAKQGESSLKSWVHQGRLAVERYTGLDFSGKANK